VKPSQHAATSGTAARLSDRFDEFSAYALDLEIDLRELMRRSVKMAANVAEVAHPRYRKISRRQPQCRRLLSSALHRKTNELGSRFNCELLSDHAGGIGHGLIRHSERSGDLRVAFAFAQKTQDIDLAG
jgi:hypothetical protein